MFDRSVPRVESHTNERLGAQTASDVRRGDLVHEAKDQSSRYREELGLPNQPCLFRQGRYKVVAIDPQQDEPMVFWMASVAGLAIAYLFGSMPTGYLVGKLLRGIDIREHGSRSTGATNVLRTLGKGPALVVLLVDVLKGAAAIVFIRLLYALPFLTPPAALALQSFVPWAVCLAALA